MAATPPGRAIVTFLTPAEQQRVEAAGAGCYTAIHHENVEQVLSDLRSRVVSAVVVSVARYQHHHAPVIARLVREFPAVPAVALLTASEFRSTQALLSLGQHGVHTLVDARDPSGWRVLRTLVASEEPTAMDTIARQRILRDLDGAQPSCARFITALFKAPCSCTTVRAFAGALDVPPTTFMTRFFRAGLPPAKRYLSYARLVRAAHYFENSGLSVTQVAFQLEFSSPQSFTRHLKVVLHLGASEFRRRYNGERMLDLMREALILPYRQQLLTFDPFAASPPWMTRRHGAAPAPASAPQASVAD